MTLKKRKPYKPRWAESGDGFLHNWVRLYTGNTKSEEALEHALCKLGKRYRAQHPFFGQHAVADFVLLDDKIVIEVDGSSHSSATAKEKDRTRTLAIEKQGWVVVRCTNADAQREPAATVEKLLMQASDRRHALSLLVPKEIQ